MSLYNLFKLDSKYLKAFVCLSVFAYIYIDGILRANVYYMDDLYRGLWGHTSWGINGRPLMSLVTIIFCGGKPLVDFSPWAQIASVLLLSYCLIMWIRKYLPEASWLKAFGVTAFFYLNLLFLENLSYKFDALGMSLSLCIPLVLFALPEDWPVRKLGLFSVGGIVALLSLYQAAIGAYISLMLLECLIFIRWGRSIGEMRRMICQRTCFMLAGGIIYKLVVLKLFMPPDWQYGTEHSALANPMTAEGLDAIGHNLLMFGGMLKEYGMSIRWLGLLLLVALLVAIICQVRQIWSERPEGRKGKLALSALAVLAPFLLVLASMVSLVLLASPVFAPRTLLSLCIFTLYLGVMIYHLGEARKFVHVLTVLMMICTLSFSSAYGNLLACQGRMDYLVQSYVIKDINELEAQSGKRFEAITYLGDSPISRELRYVRENRPMMARLIRTQDWWTGALYISCYRLLPMRSEYGDRIWEYGQTHEPVRSNEYYNMYDNGNQVIIDFKERERG